MTLRITGKHMNVGEALTAQIEDRIGEAVGKYFDGGHSGSVVVEKTGHWFECDLTLALDSGVTLQAAGRSAEPGPAFDEAAQRIEKRLRRYKRRLKDHHGNGRGEREAFYGVVEAPEAEEEVASDYAAPVIAESSTRLLTGSVADAVMHLDMTDRPVVLFVNAAHGRLNAVYRRKDGNIGWIDPAESAAGLAKHT